MDLEENDLDDISLKNNFSKNGEMQNNAHAHVLNGKNENNISSILTKLTHRTGECLKSIEELK